ncbi:Ger(x)C family spore germination protein, partial [Clostridiaceae bacterium UIB06]|nr:Ger(x)C family spore germination protein [Clostridiaceae bacterium UIB06]
MKKIMAYILMIMMMISFVGCWDQKIYENEGFVLSVGYEPSGKDKILMSFLSPVLDPNAK